MFVKRHFTNISWDLQGIIKWIILLCEVQGSTYSHWQQYLNLSRNSYWCWACCAKKLFSTCRVKILEKYLWWCTFFSKVECWRPATLLKLPSLTGNFKGFDHKYRTAANFRKAFEGHLFCRTRRADYCYLSTHLQKFWEYFNSFLIAYRTASVNQALHAVSSLAE